MALSTKPAQYVADIISDITTAAGTWDDSVIKDRPAIDLLTKLETALHEAAYARRADLD